MTKNDTNKTNSARVAEIASKIHTACSAIGPNTRDIAERQAEVQELSGQLNGIGGTRLGVATEIAAMATDESWTNGELVQACAYAAKMGNSNDSTAKTVGVFISEMKTFAHPKVRAEFPVILAACQDAWLEEQEYLAGLEGEDKKSADTPVRKFKSRIYHLTIGIARAVKDGELSVTDKDDVITYARENDPDLDEDKVAKVLARAIAGLDEIHGNFGLDEIKVAADYLRTVTAKELLAARTDMLAAAEDLAEGVTPAPAPARVTAGVIPAPAPAPNKPEPVDQGQLVTGAADLDDLMNDPAPAPMALAA